MTPGSVKLTDMETAELRRCSSMFRAKIDHTVGINLEDLGLVKWHPGSGYEITPLGRSALGKDGG